MNFEYNEMVGKRVLVTGASSGIGAAIAQLFGSCGACVGVHYRREKVSAIKVLKKIKDAGGDGHIIKGDLLKKEVRQELVESFVKKCGGIDVLVNNAGAVYNYRHFAHLTENDFDQMFALHSKAPFFMARAAFLHMKKKKWGRIINISTNAIKYASPNIVHYCASKAALEAMSAGFAREGAKDNVLVNVLRCGLIDTSMRMKTPEYGEARFQERIKMIPIGRTGKPEDIARMAVFLASAGGDFITGEVFTIAGGE